MIESSASTFAEPVGFGLRVQPFDDVIEDAFFFPSDQHLRALEFMGRALWTRARLGVVTAEQGCGKSLLIQRLLRDLDERWIVAVIQREQLRAQTFLLEVSRQYGFALEENDRTDRRRLLERFLAHQASLGRICLLVIENPQSMSPGVLEELRYLATLESEGVRILKVLLLGQPTLDLVLQAPRMMELGAQGALRFTLGALSEDQTAAYIAHRLRAAGAADPDALLPSALAPHIHACTRGVPAHINRLCRGALEAALEQGQLQITFDALLEAAAALGWSDRLNVAIGHSRPAPGASVQGARIVISLQGAPDRASLIEGARVLIGRDAEADIRIDSVFVSRYHALLVHDGRQHLLLDLGSTNGLIVNARRIARRALRHGDIIQIGPARLTYQNDQAPQTQSIDPGETVCFARPGFPGAANDEAGVVLAFGRDAAP